MTSVMENSRWNLAKSLFYKSYYLPTRYDLWYGAYCCNTSKLFFSLQIEKYMKLDLYEY